MRNKSILRLATTIVAMAIATIGIIAKAQINISIDSIDLSIDKTSFKQKQGISDFYEFIPTEVGLNDKTKASTIPHTVKVATPAMSPMSLSQIPYNYTVDKTKGIGEIDINTKIDNGSLSHSVPISIYSSSSGIQPQLALSYNSLTGNGVAGYGWCINGVSTITTVNSNYYFDGSNYLPAKLDKTSAFSLDGMRLIKTQETSTNIIYESQQGNVKVYSYFPSGKYYFDVYYPDGRMATFGYKTATTARLTYPITRLEDGIGNYVDYSYTSTSEVYYLQECKYGKNTSQIGSVKFTYGNRTDHNNTYLAGRLIKTDKILTKVDTYHQSTLLRTYSLTYEHKNYNFLSKISCKAGSQELNPLIFYYGSDRYGDEGYFQTDMAILENYFSNTKVPDLVLSKATFNNLTTSDGLIAYPKFDVFGVSGYDKKGNCTYESRYSPTQNLLIFRNLGDYFCTPQKIQTGRGFQGLYGIDYNGDGNDELVRVNYYLQDNSNARVDLTMYNSNMTPTNTYFLLEGTFAESSRVSAVPRSFITGDFLGDGKTHLLAISSYKMPKRSSGSTGEVRSYSRTSMFNLSTQTKVYDSTPFLYDYFTDAIFAIDYDGDGKTDICVVNKDGTYVYSYQGSTFKQIAYTSSLKANDITGNKKKELLIGDLNGDGLIDFLLPPPPNAFTETKSPCWSCVGCTITNMPYMYVFKLKFTHPT